MAGTCLPHRRPIQMLEHKLAMHELGGSAPDGSVLLEDVPPQCPAKRTAAALKSSTLSDKVDADGRLRWQVPDGEWIVLRIGYTCSGAQVSTSSQGWTGLVLDYLDAERPAVVLATGRRAADRRRRPGGGQDVEVHSHRQLGVRWDELDARLP